MFVYLGEQRRNSQLINQNFKSDLFLCVYSRHILIIFFVCFFIHLDSYNEIKNIRSHFYCRFIFPQSINSLWFLIMTSKILSCFFFVIKIDNRMFSDQLRPEMYEVSLSKDTSCIKMFLFLKKKEVRLWKNSREREKYWSFFVVVQINLSLLISIDLDTITWLMSFRL